MPNQKEKQLNNNRLQRLAARNQRNSLSSMPNKPQKDRDIQDEKNAKINQLTPQIFPAESDLNKSNSSTESQQEDDSSTSEDEDISTNENDRKEETTPNKSPPRKYKRINYNSSLRRECNRLRESKATTPERRNRSRETVFSTRCTFKITMDPSEDPKQTICNKLLH